MCASSSFVMQIANISIEVCGYQDEESVCLEGLKRIFCHHEVRGSVNAEHRIIVCNPERYKLPDEASLQWIAPCLGVAGLVPQHRSFLARLWSRLFSRNREIALYSGTCNVRCYSDPLHHVSYYIPEYGRWRVAHHPEEHITYVYADEHIDSADGLPSMLVNVIGSQYGCYLIFASCVSVDGGALLLTGNSGVGKSTLCRELVRQGASYMGDDLALLYMDAGQAMAGSLLFPLKYYADEDQMHKQKMDMASTSSQRPPLIAPLKGVYILHRENHPVAAPTLQSIQRGAMLEKLLKRTNKANTHADARHFVTTLSSICETVPCYDLCYGNGSCITPSFLRQP